MEFAPGKVGDASSLGEDTSSDWFVRAALALSSWRRLGEGEGDLECEKRPRIPPFRRDGWRAVDIRPHAPGFGKRRT